MKIEDNGKAQVKVITGNAAAAFGAMLSRPEVVALYPITPQSEVAEEMAKFHAEGLLDAEMVEVEGENSAMNIVCAAALAGGRVFTSTSSWGLAFMYDAVLQASGYRAPVVMANANREAPGIMAVSSGQSDLIMTRDAGWISLICENCQEILDTIIMAYRLAEDYEIQLPVMVNYDGFYLSYLAEKVEIPAREEVDAFLEPLKEQPERPRLRPGKSIAVGTHGILEGFVELRYKHSSALERAKDKFDRIDREFRGKFGRGYGGQIEVYRCEDADIIMVAAGSVAGTVKKIVDVKREQGVKVGLVRMKMFRPFPRERMTGALKGCKAIGVVDRSVCLGWNCGPFFMELRALSQDFGLVPMMSFIHGLANVDISPDDVGKMIDMVDAASRGESYREVTWFSMDE
ncbi:MAG: pyruvate synthase subunit PorA [Deltaproteobacteria bacterium]|nr:pyruvate synthase subunit PorA [Deltaproteobacteria bacterium]MBW2137834.1 pyruvate synthase subunit PorA [Deltaproteobacteria bacterium]